MPPLAPLTNWPTDYSSVVFSAFDAPITSGFPGSIWIAAFGTPRLVEDIDGRARQLVLNGPYRVCLGTVPATWQACMSEYWTHRSQVLVQWCSQGLRCVSHFSTRRPQLPLPNIMPSLKVIMQMSRISTLTRVASTVRHGRIRARARHLTADLSDTIMETARTGTLGLGRPVHLLRGASSAAMSIGRPSRFLRVYTTIYHFPYSLARASKKAMILCSGIRTFSVGPMRG